MCLYTDTIILTTKFVESKLDTVIIEIDLFHTQMVSFLIAAYMFDRL